MSRLTICKLEEMEDEELMTNYREGTADAFDVLYARHKGGLYRYFLRQLNNRPEIATELFQDVWMKLINSRLSYQPSAKFSTYLYLLAQNRLIDYWRSEKHRSNQLEYIESVGANYVEPGEKLLQVQINQKIKQAIAALPEDQRNAILLKEEGAFSLAEIAEITGVNRETVKSRLRYAIKRLQGILHPLRSIS